MKLFLTNFLWHFSQTSGKTVISWTKLCSFTVSILSSLESINSFSDSLEDLAEPRNKLNWIINNNNEKKWLLLGDCINETFEVGTDWLFKTDLAFTWFDSTVNVVVAVIFPPLILEFFN